MQCYTELIPPTGVTHATFLPFLGPRSNNLVIAKTSLLQVFHVKPTALPDDEKSNGHGKPLSKLSLVGEYRISGTVTALAAINLPTTRTGGAALLCAFKDAKLSLIEWDPENHRVSTVSIHYYEGDNVLLPPFGPSLLECDSILTVDPTSRCAAFKFGERQLAIIPFRQQGDELVEEEAQDGDMVVDGEGKRASTLELKRTVTGEGPEGEARTTPYKASFVLPLTMLDPALTHPIDLAFLHEYREPTFGILSASRQPSTALLEERRDCLSYMVFTLDLEERASTNLLSVTNLPSDLWRIVPLAAPIGGTLLVGTNELIHIDQSGKATAVAVNEYARSASRFPMHDQSDLGMKLEGCEIEMLDATVGDLLIILNDGSFATLNIKTVGRNVAGLAVTRTSDAHGGHVNTSAASCVARTESQYIFIGSEDGDSTLVAWSKEMTSLSRKRSHAQMLGHDTAGTHDEVVEDDDDDLYAQSTDVSKDVAAAASTAKTHSAPSYRFRLADVLRSLGPINCLCLGRPPASEKDRLEIVAGICKGRASRIAFLHRDAELKSVHSRQIDSATEIWSLCARSREAARAGPDDEIHNLLFIYNGEITKAYQYVGEDNVRELDGTDFEREGETVSVAALAGGSCIIQCQRSEIRTYDNELNLSQIIPMSDDETDKELKIVATSFSASHVLVLRDDSSIHVAQVDKNGDVESLELPQSVGERKWTAGCLCSGFLGDDQTVACLLDEHGGLHILSLSDMDVVYTAPTLPFLPPILSADAPQRRGARATLTEILVTELGSTEESNHYLIIRTAMDDLILYEPFYYDAETGTSVNAAFAHLRFRKVPFTYVPKFDELLGVSDVRPKPLQSVIIGGRKVVYIPGRAPSLIFKEAVSLPRAISMRVKDVATFAACHRPNLGQGFAITDLKGMLTEYRLAPNASFETGWCVETLPLGEPQQEIRHVAFHDQRGVYVIASCRDVDYVPSEDDDSHGDEDTHSLRPQVPRYTLHLLSATTHDVIQSLEMPNLETVTSLKVMQLEVSEHTHEQKAMVVVGTAIQRGEDAPARGAVTVFNIIDVVPEPDRPETGIKLHIQAREETKGAITALEAFPFGLVGTAQGQKIMIRGLKEDGTCLPVAFLDAQTYTSNLKTFGASGLWLAADAWKGLWLGGFTEEPYRLSLLGKSRTQMEVMAAEFLPFDGHLHVVAIDAHMDLHVLQYDPEDPKTVGGQRLLHRSTFHLGHWPSEMMLLPSELAPFSQQESMMNGHAADAAHGAESKPGGPKLYHVLTTFQSGAVGLITPVDESTYRRLGAIQTQLTSILEHAAGLNPRAYRAVESEALGGRGVVDGTLIERIGELGVVRRAEVLGRASTDAWILRSDLEIIRGGGLSYL